MGKTRAAATILVWAVLVTVGVPGALAHLGLDLQIAELDERIEAAPRDASLRVRRGELCRLHGETARALDDFKAARRLDPSLTVVDFHLGRLYHDTGRLRAAEKTLTRFLRREPEHVTGYVERGRVRVSAGRPLEAAADLTRAIDLRRAADGLPRPSWYIERARALAAGGDERLATAISGLDEGLAVLGRPVTLQLEAIELELRAGRTDSAIARLRIEAERTPRPESWLERIGDVQTDAGRTDDAARSYRAALDALERVPASRRWTPATRELEQRVRDALDRLTASATAERGVGR